MLSTLRSWIMTSPKPDDPPAPLQSTWRVSASAGEPVAVVRVRNLSGTLPVGRDAWGRANRPQPALITTEVSFAQPFGAASANDSVAGADTAHYGNLSKNLLGSLAVLGAAVPSKDPEVMRRDQAGGGPGAGDVFEMLWVGLTGRVVDGSTRALPPDRVPFLNTDRLRSLELTVRLPKASLVGDGVSLAVVACFGGGGEEGGNPVRSYARSLKLHGLRVPTLVGVNANEREAKQMVVADVEVDRLDIVRDIHPELERLVVGTMESSSFETLEALGALIAEKVLADLKIDDDPKTGRERGWQVKISLAKPIAVPFADCPEVMIKAGNDLS